MGKQNGQTEIQAGYLQAKLEKLPHCVIKKMMYAKRGHTGSAMARKTGTKH